MFRYLQKMANFTILCGTLIHNAETLLAPICSWPKDLQECKNIFPPDRILADAFFDEVNDSKVWEHLEEEGFVRGDMITQGRENSELTRFSSSR